MTSKVDLKAPQYVSNLTHLVKRCTLGVMQEENTISPKLRKEEGLSTAAAECVLLLHATCQTS